MRASGGARSIGAGFLAVAGLASLLLPAAAQPQQGRRGRTAQRSAAVITLSSDGERPNVLVDQIGTAHVVWNQSTSQGSPDVLHYCRILRGASACTGEQTFVPPESPPEGNKDVTGPRVVQTSPDQIVLLTHRYPAVVVSNEPGGEPNPSCFQDNPQNLERCFAS
jgi:hypothetical protein